MVQCCIVLFCKNRGKVPGLSYYRLTSKRYLSWLRAIGRNPQIEKLSHSNAICSEHFVDADFIYEKGMKRLKPDAVPTLKLGPRKPLPAVVNPVPCIDVDIPSTSSDTLACDQMTLQVYIEADKENVDISQKSGPSSSIQIMSHNKQDALKTNRDHIFKNVSILNRRGANMTHTYRASSTGTGSDTDSSTDTVSDADFSIQRKRRYLKIEHSYVSTFNNLRKELEESKNKLVEQRKKLFNVERLLKILKIRLNLLKCIIKDLKEKNALSKNTLQHLQKIYSNVPDALMKKIMVLIESGTNSSHHPEEIRDFAMTLHFYSARAYNYVRKTSFSSS